MTMTSIAETVNSSNDINGQTKFNERTLIRREIQQIITRRLPNQYKRRVILRQAMAFENILYKRAPCMEYYSDLSTLERRVIQAAEALLRTNLASAATTVTMR